MSLKEKHKKTFWIHLFLKGYGVEWYDDEIPTPSYIRYADSVYLNNEYLRNKYTNSEYEDRGYFIAWEIDGFFSTTKSIEYFNDTIGRIIMTFKDLKPEVLDYKPIKDNNSHNNNKIYTLADLKVFKRLSTKKLPPKRADNYKNPVFWGIKFYTEDLIREYGQGTPIPYSLIEHFALANFKKEKDISTLKAKCKSIWNWYNKKDWKIPKKIKLRKTKNDEELKITRQKNASINSKNIENKTRELVIDAITGEYPKEYKKKSGAWHIKIISESIKVNTKTVSKYIKESENKKES